MNLNRGSVVTGKWAKITPWVVLFGASRPNNNTLVSHKELPKSDDILTEHHISVSQPCRRTQWQSKLAEIYVFIIPLGTQYPRCTIVNNFVQRKFLSQRKHCWTETQSGRKSSLPRRQRLLSDHLIWSKKSNRWCIALDLSYPMHISFYISDQKLMVLLLSSQTLLRCRIIRPKK